MPLSAVLPPLDLDLDSGFAAAAASSLSLALALGRAGLGLDLLMFFTKNPTHHIHIFAVIPGTYHIPLGPSRREVL